MFTHKYQYSTLYFYSLCNMKVVTSDLKLFELQHIGTKVTCPVDIDKNRAACVVVCEHKACKCTLTHA